ncbi:MAG: nuclear transport factor 2 family protein [Gaiella sp.]
MSHVDGVLAAYAAFSAGDRDGALQAFAEDVEWHQAEGLPHGGVYHGVDEVRRHVFGPLETAWWDAFDARLEEIYDAGKAVVARGRYVGRAKSTGRELDVPFVHVWEFGDGERATRFRQYLDTQGWNDALRS